MVKGPSVGIDSGSKDCVNLPLSTAVFRFMENSSQTPLNRSAALLLAAAVVELFPGTLLLSGEGTPTHFFFDLLLPFPFQKDLLGVIEERMRCILKERRGVRSMEMLPSNAANMMRHHRQELVAEQLLSLQRATVLLYQYGTCVAYFPGEEISSPLVIPFFKLFEGFLLKGGKEGCIRIVGAASSDKQKVKEFFKLPKISSRMQTKLLEPLGEEGFWIWTPQGEVVRRAFVHWWEGKMQEQHFALISTPAAFLGDGDEAAWMKVHLAQSKEKKTAELALMASSDEPSFEGGFLSPKVFFADRSYQICDEEKLLQECISSLHFILQLPKILNFEFELVLVVSSGGPKKGKEARVALVRKALEASTLQWKEEKREAFGNFEGMIRVEVRMADALGRRWAGPFLGIPQGKEIVLVRSLFGSLERIVALLLERAQGLKVDELCEKLYMRSTNSELAH